jgi:dTDP-4-amino-4,6-dideoxygalactose transaminase
MNKVPFAKPVVDKEMLDAVTNALQNERLVGGESVHKFEEAFAKYCGVKHAVSLSSGTNALQLALVALDVKDKEVQTTPFSFIATANAVIEAGGKPTFSDASDHDYNMDPAMIPEKLTKRTAALLPVHLFGRPCQMDEIVDIASERGLKVVEDACQAHGSLYKGKKAGSIGDIGCFSFYPTKNMTVGGDGGMITTNDTDIAKTIAKYRDCGRISRYVHDVVGYTSRLNTANAAFGLVQLKHLDKWNEQRRGVAKMYNKNLAGIEGIRLPPMGDKDITPVFHLYTVRCSRRDDLAEHLNKNGIEAGVHYPVPIHIQPIYKQLYGFKGGEFPVSEALANEMISLPMFPEMSEDEVKLVSEKIRTFYSRSR